MSEENILIDQAAFDFLMQIYYQHGVIRDQYRIRKLQFTKDANRTKQYGIVRELIQRSRRFGPAAKMTALERAAIQSFAEFLVQTFHDLQGTPEDARPRISFVPGGGTMWATEGSNRQES